MKIGSVAAPRTHTQHSLTMRGNYRFLAPAMRHRERLARVNSSSCSRSEAALLAMIAKQKLQLATTGVHPWGEQSLREILPELPIPICHFERLEKRGPRRGRVSPLHTQIRIQVLVVLTTPTKLPV